MKRGSGTILAVDDNPVMLQLVDDILSPLGYMVLRAVSGKDALHLSSNFGGRIDLLLTDVIMPEMTGMELVEAFKENHPEIKVLFISGYMGPAISPREEGNREKGFLQKPIIPRQLIGKLRQMLES